MDQDKEAATPLREQLFRPLPRYSIRSMRSTTQLNGKLASKIFVTNWRFQVRTIASLSPIVNDPNSDLTTRSGLRKVYSDFEQLNSRLHAAYNAQGSTWMIKGAVVGIYAKMSVDSVLSSKVFKEGTSRAVILNTH
jgi:hypothetical protein